MKLKIKKGATVEVISGSEKGQRGTVLDVNTTKMRVRIQGVKLMTKATKEDGLVKKEASIHYSNVRLVEAATAAPKKKAAKKTAKSKTA